MGDKLFPAIYINALNALIKVQMPWHPPESRPHPTRVTPPFNLSNTAVVDLINCCLLLGQAHREAITNAIRETAALYVYPSI